MATPPMEYLNSMWQYIPQGHEKPLKHAVYNTVANIFILLAAAIFVAVYFILSPFLRPLYWAILCGTFLYPFKRSLTNVLRFWLKSLQASNTPFIFGAVALPFQVAHKVTDTITNTIWENIRPIVFFIVVSPLCYTIYYFGPLQHLLSIVQFVLSFLYNLLGYFSSLWLWTVFCSYFLVLVFFWTPESQQWLPYLTLPVWTVFMLHIVNIAGCLRVPLLIVMLVIMTAGFYAEIRQAGQVDAQHGESPKPSNKLYSKIRSVLGSSTDVSLADDSSLQSDTETLDSKTQEIPDKTPLIPKAKHIHTRPDKPVHLKLDTANALKSKLTKGKSVDDQKYECESTQYFVAVFWGHMIVRFWMHVWLGVVLVLLPLIYHAAKFVVQQFNTGGMFHEHAESFKASVRQWLESRKDVLMPKSLRGLGKLTLKGDQKMISILEHGLDNATSIVFILMLLVGTSIFTIIAGVQIQRESMYMISTTQTVLNNTMNSDMAQWLPNAEEMRGTIDQILNKTHAYGRNFIASKVKEYVDGSSREEQDNIVNQVLEIWDNIYASMLSTEGTKEGHLAKVASDVNEEIFQLIVHKPDPDIPNMGTLWTMLNQGSTFQVSNIVEFVKANIGMFLSVLESVWAVVKGNMTLILTIVSSILSALLGGGTAILNFVISAIIFLTALFYLLASSGDMYKPMEIFSNMSPGSTGNRLGQAVEEAISGVFMASLKMASFYGLYTWLLHLMFGMDIVFIPSALAAVLAAMPFLGPYWASLPAVIELWLVHGQGISASLLFLAHWLPSYFVDTAIYSEIKGGHPYVTGLAIAGGIYCLGLEGAIIGPMVLIFLFVGMSMYSSMLQNEPSTPTPVSVSSAIDTLEGYFMWGPRLRSVSSDSLSMPRPSPGRKMGEFPVIGPHSLQHFGK